MSAKILFGNLGESALQAGIFHAVDKVIYEEALLSSEGIKKAVLSGACHMASESVSNMLMPAIVPMSSSLKSLENQFAEPLVAGALYCVADKAISVDGRSWMTKLLHVAGASVASKYSYEPVKKLIGY